MAPRRWRTAPALSMEGVQTGDGRVMADGCFEWAGLPLPLMWSADGDGLHVDLVTATPQVGIIELIERRDGGVIYAEGTMDDEREEAADIIARLEAGEAPLGARFPVSVDPDNWDVEVIMTDAAEADDMLLFASGRGPITQAAVRSAVASCLRAAAGDPDPGEDGGEGGEVIFQDSVDEILERYTRLRIRGATLINIAAFDQAAIELAPQGAGEEQPPPEEEPPAEEPEPEESVAASALVSVPERPPVDWFRVPEPEAGDERLVQQLDGSWAVPLTITDDGQVYGHIARRGQAHRGYSSYVPPPLSRTGYREFHTGLVVCEDGTEMPTGAMIVGCEHATLELTLGEANDHYAHAGQGWADVRCVDGEFGPWVCGALRPSVTEADLRVLRALSPSGDWRPTPTGLEMCSVLSVNVPGFPVAREAMAASALAASAADSSGPRARVEDGQVVALVAAGMVTRCSECAERAREREALAAGLASTDRVLAALEEHRATLRLLEHRTRHLEPMAASAAVERAKGSR